MLSFQNQKRASHAGTSRVGAICTCAGGERHGTGLLPGFAGGRRYHGGGSGFAAGKGSEDFGSAPGAPHPGNPPKTANVGRINPPKMLGLSLVFIPRLLVL